MTQITQERLKSLLDYNPSTGVFIWKVKGSSRTPAGSIAGTKNTLGYVVFRVDGVLHYAHRLAWLYVTGSMPAHGIDHKNGTRSNNCFANLREATQSQNNENLVFKRKNSKFPIGVGFCKVKNLFRARIAKSKKSIDLGYFHSMEAAHQAYLTAKKTIHTFNPTPRALQS